jgi:hypothetical protein
MMILSRQKKCAGIEINSRSRSIRERKRKIGEGVVNAGRERLFLLSRRIRPNNQGHQVTIDFFGFSGFLLLSLDLDATRHIARVHHLHLHICRLRTQPSSSLSLVAMQRGINSSLIKAERPVSLKLGNNTSL